MLRRIVKRIFQAASTIIKEEFEWIQTRRFLRKRAMRWQL